MASSTSIGSARRWGGGDLGEGGGDCFLGGGGNDFIAFFMDFKASSHFSRVIFLRVSKRPFLIIVAISAVPIVF